MPGPGEPSVEVSGQNFFPHVAVLSRFRGALIQMTGVVGLFRTLRKIVKSVCMWATNSALPQAAVFICTPIALWDYGLLPMRRPTHRKADRI